MELFGETAMIKGILQLLYSIIYNLCDNAIKYNHKDGSVSVEVKHEKTFLLISVKGSGIGIEEQVS